jgi:hypothetical protein
LVFVMCVDGFFCFFVGVLVCLGDRRLGEEFFFLGGAGLLSFIDGFLLCRVALARAVYARTKYVLLDDPLSAVVCWFFFS